MHLQNPAKLSQMSPLPARLCMSPGILHPALMGVLLQKDVSLHTHAHLACLHARWLTHTDPKRYKCQGSVAGAEFPFLWLWSDTSRCLCHCQPWEKLQLWARGWCCSSRMCFQWWGLAVHVDMLRQILSTFLPSSSSSQWPPTHTVSPKNCCLSLCNMVFFSLHGNHSWNLSFYMEFAAWICRDLKVWHSSSVDRTIL